MISLLKGKPVLSGSTLTILTGGVGYEVHVAPHLLSNANQQSDLTLHIYTHVREEQLALYGFETPQEKSLFLLVLGVSGVGPTTALTIVSAGASRVISAVQQAEVSFFSSLPRIGKKVAQKIIIELGSKLGEIKQLELGPQTPLVKDLSETLIGMGFDESRVIETLSTIDVEKLGLTEALKIALRSLKT